MTPSPRHLSPRPAPSRSTARSSCCSRRPRSATRKRRRRRAGAQRHRHLLRRHGDGSLSVFRGHEECRDVVAWIKAQADFTRATLDRIPGREALLAQDRRAGRRRSGARVERAGQQRQLLLPEAAGEREHPQALRARRASRARSACSSIPRRSKDARGQHFAIDYFAPSPDNQYVAYGISPGGSEESVLHVVEVATGKETRRGDRPRAIRPAVLDRRQSPALQPPAEARARRAAIGQVSEEPRLRPRGRHRPRARSRDPRSRRRARHRARIRSRLRSSSRPPARRTRSASSATATSASSPLRGARGVAGARRPAVAARRRSRRRSDRRRVDRQHAVSAHAQERAAFQGAARRSRESRTSRRRRSSCRRAPP